MTDELDRRLRRLLRVYPRWYRRHRGAELLGTLLDGATEDQTRPTRAQRRDVIRSGLACRLRVRGGRGATAVAVLLAIAATVVGACLGAWLSWLQTPGLPSAAQTAAIAGTAFDGVEPDSVRGDPARFTYDAELDGAASTDPAWLEAVLGGDDYGNGAWIAEFEGRLSGEKWDAVVPGIADRLRADGWRVTESGYTDRHMVAGANGFDLTAVRDGHELRVDAYRDDATATADVWLNRADPADLREWLIAGAAAGLLAGWLFAVRLAAQVTVVNPRHRYPTLLILTIAFQVAFLPLLATGLFIGLYLADSDQTGSGVPWWPLMAFPYRPMLLLATGIAAVGLGFAVVPARRGRPVRGERYRQTA